MKTPTPDQIEQAKTALVFLLRDELEWEQDNQVESSVATALRTALVVLDIYAEEQQKSHDSQA